MKVIISFATYRVEAELYDTPTGRSIYAALPIQRNVNRWGDEIYFEIPVLAQYARLLHFLWCNPG